MHTDKKGKDKKRMGRMGWLGRMGGMRGSERRQLVGELSGAGWAGPVDFPIRANLR
jgi:hypothetical protein